MTMIDLGYWLEEAADLVEEDGVTPDVAVNRVAAKACGGPQDGTDLGLQLPGDDGADCYAAALEALCDAVHRTGAPALPMLPADFRGVHVLRNAAQWANRAAVLADPALWNERKGAR